MIEIVVFADLVRAAGAVIVERAFAGGRQAGEVDIIHLITAPGGIIDIVVKIIHIQIDLVIDIRLIGHIAGGRRGVDRSDIDYQVALNIIILSTSSLFIGRFAHEGDDNLAVAVLLRDKNKVLNIGSIEFSSGADFFFFVVIIENAVILVREISKADILDFVTRFFQTGVLKIL